MNTDHLRYFQKLAEVGHYGKASKDLHITQPALSNSISKLERELGFALFEKEKESGRSVALTIYGKEFKRHIDTALSEINKAINVAGPRSLDASPTLAVATVASIQRDYLPRLLMGFVKETGHLVNFDIHEERSSFSCMRAVLNGDLDLAICGHIPDEDELGWIPIFAQRIVAVVNTAHPLASRKSVSLEDLKDYPVVTYRDNTYLYYPLKELAESNGLVYRQAFESEANGAVQVLADVRLVALVLDTFDGAIRESVHILPIDELTSPFHMVGLVYREKDKNSLAVKVFVEYVKRVSKKVEGIVPLENNYIKKHVQK